MIDINALLEAVINYFKVLIPDLIGAFAIAFISWFAGKWAKRFVENSAQRMGWDEILWSYVGTFLRYLVVIIGFISALKRAGVPIDALLATFGISGVIIGLGARQSIANYFAGIMMLAARPFRQGDLIEFGPPPQIGRITEVKMTYTGLVTLDNVRLVVPNSVIWRNKIVNFTSLDMRAIRIPISIPYDVDVDWVRDLVLHVLKQHPHVLDDPDPMVTTSDVTADDTKALVVAWSHVDSMNTFGEVVTQMRKAFETAGLQVKVPAKDVDLKREE